MSPFQTHLDLARAELWVRREAVVRSLLESWVSELEPSVVQDQHGEIVGLTIADLPLGTRAPIVVKNPLYRAA